MVAATRELYESGGYLEANPGWHQEDSPWKVAQIERLLGRHGLTLESVAEVGCGAGEIIRLLAQRHPHWSCQGFEISPQAFAIAREKASANLVYSQSNPFEVEGRFDLAMALDVFEHVEDFFSFLRAMRRISRHQIYHVPLDMHASGILRERPIMEARSEVGHIHYFTKYTALAALRETGHEVVDYFYTAGALDLPGSSLRTKLTSVPRRLMFALAPDFTVRAIGGWSLIVLCR